MSGIPGAAFSITGASGSQGLLSPRDSWRAYVFPRGAFASQDSTGTLITFDSAAIASRFAVNNWIQPGLATANLRKISAVGGNSLSVSGAAVTVVTGDRIFLVGNTQPTVSGGSATYTIPNTTIRKRDDSAADLYTNSMVTATVDGLVRFYSTLGQYDVLIQDSNQSNQGYIADLAVGATEGVSTSDVVVFGATVTINATLGVTGTVIGDTFTVNKALGVTGWAMFGSTVTMNASAGVTGTFTGSTVTVNRALGVTGWATFGASVTVAGALGVTGWGTFGMSVTVAGALGVTSTITGSSDISFRRVLATQATAFSAADAGVSLSSGWGTGPNFSMSGKDQAGRISITAGTTTSASPTVTFYYKDGAWGGGGLPVPIACRGDEIAPTTAYWSISTFGDTAFTVKFVGTPVALSTYWLYYHVMGR